jgi:hypothetical protein
MDGMELLFAYIFPIYQRNDEVKYKKYPESYSAPMVLW